MTEKINHHQLDATVRIGKAGITENLVKQVVEQLKKKKNVIKVKFLPSAVGENKKALVRELALKARARVVHAVGFIAVLERKTKSELIDEEKAMERVK